jgi:HPt (histidine-containing phosphotransfer) domain-containing protein
MNILDEPSLDLDALSILKEATEEMFPEIIEAFLEDAPNRLNSLREASTNNDVTAMKEESHCLKGSSGNVGAVKLSKICEEIETLSKSDSIANQEELIQYALHEFEHIKIELPKMI